MDSWKIGRLGKSHREPNCRRTMHRCFGWLGSWVECVGGCYGGFSCSLEWLRKLCGIEPKVDIEMLNMTQKNKKKKKKIDDKKEEPLQRRKGKAKAKREREGGIRERGYIYINYVIVLY